MQKISRRTFIKALAFFVTVATLDYNGIKMLAEPFAFSDPSAVRLVGFREDNLSRVWLYDMVGTTSFLLRTNPNPMHMLGGDSVEITETF